ncbi:MAG TPA: hypothetical protein VE033_02820 [Acetobacteraceae bacterium]|jgi:hypothetical protein|nr:hypothetical protein [Acetobacteraceae bacterium]
MTAAARPGRPVLEVLLNALGLAIWAAHFTAIYATNALACARGLANTALFGLPFVPVLVTAFTVAALGGLALVMRSALRGLNPPLDEGGEAEPRFTRWFAFSTAALASLAVLFQGLPALVVPPCG